MPGGPESKAALKKAPSSLVDQGPEYFKTTTMKNKLFS